jgi:membrane-bound serine protease (ClpP class)
MYWKRIAAILMVLIDEMVFTVFFFGILPFFDVHLPLKVYFAVMAVLVMKDFIVVKLIWNVVVGPPQTGKEALIGKIGVVYTDMDSSGIVRVDNELWQAETVIPLKKGEKVKVKSINGLFLEVEPVATDNIH